MRRLRLAAACALLAALAASGCRRRLWYEWRDEPYIRPCYRRGEKHARRRLGSAFSDEREIGCRALAVMAREARAAGEREKTRRLARVLMDHYGTEADPQVRSTILALCLRDAGPGDVEVQAFLKAKLNAGEHPASAAYALAAMHAPGAFEALDAALARAGSFELRYELLGALWLLGDRRAVPVFERALAELDSTWPPRVHHMPRPVYRKALRGRLATLKASCGGEGANSGALTGGAGR